MNYTEDHSYIHTVSNFLTSERCKEIIDFSENHPKAKITDIEHGLHPKRCRLKFTDNELAEELFPVVLDKFPKLPSDFMFHNTSEGDVWLPEKMHSAFKIYRYSTGQHFVRHQDVQSWDGKKSNRLFSMMRLLVYLNDDYEGGETVFEESDTVVIPQTGMAALFKMEYWHSGNTIIEGTKYMLLGDILFRRTENQNDNTNAH